MTARERAAMQALVDCLRDMATYLEGCREESEPEAWAAIKEAESCLSDGP